MIDDYYYLIILNLTRLAGLRFIIIINIKKIKSTIKILFYNENLNYYIIINDKYLNYNYKIYREKTTSYIIYYTTTTIYRFTNLNFNFNRYLVIIRSF